jgi:hypothetical protein
VREVHDQTLFFYEGGRKISKQTFIFDQRRYRFFYLWQYKVGPGCMYLWYTPPPRGCRRPAAKPCRAPVCSGAASCHCTSTTSTRGPIKVTVAIPIPSILRRPTVLLPSPFYCFPIRCSSSIATGEHQFRASNLACPPLLDNHRGKRTRKEAAEE